MDNSINSHTNIEANFNPFNIFPQKYFHERVIIALFAVEKGINIKYL